MAFGGEVDNGGVYQFFLNRPKHVISVLEVWQELGEKQLEVDYTKVLEEFLSKSDFLNQSTDIVNNEQLNWDERYQGFIDGKVEIKSAKLIEGYFFEDDFKRKLFQNMTLYIEKHIRSFAIIVN